MLDVDDLIERKLVHEVHTSERKSYRACRRRWDWVFRENYYPVMTAKPLEFGTAFHLGMEVYYDPDTWSFPRDVVAEFAIQKFVEKCERQRTKFLQQNNVSYIEADVQADYDERVELGRGMLKHYFDKVAPRYDNNWTPVKVEVGFMLPIPHPKTGEAIWCKCKQCVGRWTKYIDRKADSDAEAESRRRREAGEAHTMVAILPDYNWEEWQGLPVVYAGRCDAVFQDAEGYYWIVDWKTARTVSVDREEFLELDDQIMSYVWALRKLGLPIRGFIYHEQKKGWPQAPKQNKVRRLGRIFSVAQNQDTDYPTYLATVSTEDTKAYEDGLYDDYLLWLKNEGPVFYARWQIHKSEEQCRQAEINIGKEALEMISDDLLIYPSPGRFGCGFCAFRQPCLEVNAGGDYLYGLETMFERREAYYLRPEPSTESKGGE